MASPSKRVTPSDEAFLRRFRAEMKFTHAGPLAPVLDPIRPVKPARGPSGIVLRKQPRYTPSSPESWMVESRLPAETVAALESSFGREYGSAPDAPDVPEQKRRSRGRRGGRKSAPTVQP